MKTVDHTHKATAAGMRLLWMLRRTFSTWSPDLFTKLYATIIRPVLEYGVPAFFPCTKGEAKALEGVQRLGSRMVTSLRGFPYESRCKSLNLYTMAYRRYRADLIHMFAIIVLHQYPDLEHIFSQSVDPRTRGHPYKLAVQRTDGLPHVYRLSRRAVPAWNALPADVLHAPSVEQFKQRLDAHCASQTLFSPFSLL